MRKIELVDGKAVFVEVDEPETPVESAPEPKAEPVKAKRQPKKK